MKLFTPQVVLFDVDGVLTPGNFFYSADGKIMKEFGADDHDGICLLKKWVDIQFVTGDRKGFPITERRVSVDMKMPLHLVSTVRRFEWIKERWDPKTVIYMGDGIFDNWIFSRVGYSICTGDGCEIAKEAAAHVTRNVGGRRAVAEACLHILEKFYEPYNPDNIPSEFNASGEWAV